jgi:hypothetical protein
MLDGANFENADLSHLRINIWPDIKGHTAAVEGVAFSADGV